MYNWPQDVHNTQVILCSLHLSCIHLSPNSMNLSSLHMHKIVSKYLAAIIYVVTHILIKGNDVGFGLKFLNT